jgi:hypothetical protein
MKIKSKRRIEKAPISLSVFPNVSRRIENLVQYLASLNSLSNLKALKHVIPMLLIS